MTTLDEKKIRRLHSRQQTSAQMMVCMCSKIVLKIRVPVYYFESKSWTKLGVTMEEMLTKKNSYFQTSRTRTYMKNSNQADMGLWCNFFFIWKASPHRSLIWSTPFMPDNIEQEEDFPRDCQLWCIPDYEVPAPSPVHATTIGAMWRRQNGQASYAGGCLRHRIGVPIIVWPNKTRNLEVVMDIRTRKLIVIGS